MFGNIDTPKSTQPETEPKQTSWSLLKRELIRYLEAQFDAVEDKEEFELLLWWKTYTYRYPVLSHLARDILVIPVSTVSSDQAFSISGRIIEPRRSCLSPEMVKTRQACQTRPADRSGTARRHGPPEVGRRAVSGLVRNNDYNNFLILKNDYNNFQACHYKFEEKIESHVLRFIK
ncbi:hypothetical protein Ddye_020919 [Dipteronia dyeriana]|uniref:HAT C-terminal dimerisation domain-containing protein n=1 Tax=Dipteronia dyeriana TaxID=168575 RepID=A0AAD9U1Q3_9ROSI|nr:hypothetical protein Ddye_020919 [Dipteronia dyeriana]